jgi:hypothetical protein
MIGRAAMRDAEVCERFQEARRGELRAVVGGQRQVGCAAGGRASTACSTAANASSLRQRCARFQPTISRSGRSH